ncbi:hypothetical protein PPYR_04292 [Photinus pyralis]|uniref:G-protein coupled receptors family 2 profile 2 domain-containing protein n=2 Tax=Photinus pyralis TaxID=7054 RepID=A0A5N4AXQ9_PHOPY|nr:uncharacterized protein LOC116164641 [Photinus pyralis]KAB0802106.1 hypothetical protein PPYR_04292 [Photinus pyralis]
MRILEITNLLLILVQLSGTKCECGETLTAKTGIIHTPNFPNEFSVPILCKWVIDASEISTPNTSIVVYLTQLFVLEGLSFEEYETYDRRYNILGKQIHAVFDNNISKVRWVKTRQNVMVVTFQLGSIENTHLRILDNFLDVFGFNLTYEITTEPVRSDSCTMSDCGFTGICYDNLTNFYCQCFPGYTGPTCSDGYNSLCTYDGSPYCKNGGKCRHIGTSAVRCECGDDYIGDRCQRLSRQNVHNCNVHSCKCFKDARATPGDGPDLSTTLRLMHGPNLRKETLQAVLQNQILASKLSAIAENVRVSHLNYYDWGSEATVYFNGLKRDRKKLESLIHKWTYAGRIGNLTLIDTSIGLRNDSLQFIKNLTINQVGPIRENGHFVLSCVAHGSSSMIFRWYKDGFVINTTFATNNKWSRLIQSPQQNRYTSLLGIERVTHRDEGLFVCEAEDGGIKQCLSRNVEITKPPVVKIEPTTLTVQKGENFTIKCICMANKNSDHKYTYSWTKNKLLLPIKTEMEKYEILFPGGSILQVSRIEKTTVYSCLVQDEVTSTEVSIRIDVVDRTLIHTCRGEKSMNILWPETAPGTQNIQECPKGFTGSVKRWCVLHDAEKSLWQLPDFSLCTADALLKANTELQSFMAGYGEGSSLKTLGSYNDYVHKQPSLLPGEGVRILSLAGEVITFVNMSNDFAQIRNMTSTFFSIVDGILKHSNSLIDQEQVIYLQETIQNELRFSALVTSSGHYHQVYNSLVVNLLGETNPNFVGKIPLERQRYPSWFKYELEVIYSGESIHGNTSVVLACIVYKNLSDFLPRRSAIRLRDAAEMEYEIISNIATVSVVQNNRLVNLGKFSFAMQFDHYVVNTNITRWRINCSVASYATYGYDWNLNECHTIIINATVTKCVCSRPGTYTVLVTTMPLTQVNVDELETYQVLVLVSCCLCLLFSGLTACMLMAHWTLIKSSLAFLKVQYCCVLSASMAMFVTALSTDVPNEFFPYINTSLEIFLLIALSSHISKCLIVFADLVRLSKTQNLSKTIVAISTGVPVITVFASHLTHRTIGRRQLSWWLINGSVSFNIFVTAFLIIIVLYNVMYLVVMEKLTQCGDKPSVLVIERKRLLRRSFCIFWATVVMVCSSIMYVNMKESSYWNYAFALSNVLLVTIFFTCYIAKSEVELFGDFLERCRARATQPSASTSGSTSSSSKQDCDYPSSKSKGSNRQMGSSKSIIMLSDLQNTANYGKNDGDTPNIYKPVQEFMYSPDVVATRVHVELDLVAPIMHDQSKTPEDNPIILCNIAVNSRCEVSPSFPDLQPSKNEKSILKSSDRQQPEGVEKVTNETENASDSLDGMLDKISHDLDYLLNRNGSTEKCNDNDDFQTSF